MGKPDSPEPPDPRQTARAALDTSLATSKANAYMGANNAVGPYGSVKQVQTGSKQIRDPFTGKMINVPVFTQKTTLAGPQREMLRNQNQAGMRMGDMALDRLGSLGTRVPVADDAARRRIETALFDRMQPGMDRDRAAMEARLADQGLTLGSKAYGAAQDDFGRGVTDARLATIAQGGQEMERLQNMALQGRQQNMGEIMALLGKGSPSMPQVGGAGAQGMPTTDVAGLINNNFNAQNAQYQQQMGQYNNTMGGLFGLGAALLAPSDRRLKRDIVKVDKRGGLNLYEYRYVWDKPGTVHRGFMAQEVAKVLPQAVVRFGEWLGLDYAQLPEVV